MSKKLTLNISNDGLIGMAKEYAKSKGQSLSNIVENFLLQLSGSKNLSKSKKSKLKNKGELLKFFGAFPLPKKSHDHDPIYDKIMGE